MYREIKVLKDFRNANIVNLRQVFREKGKLYIIFDYIERTLLEECGFDLLDNLIYSRTIEGSPTNLA